MFSAPRILVYCLRLCGGVALLVGYAMYANAAQPGGNLASPKAAAASEMLEEQFDNPESIIKTFVSELEKLVDKKEAVSPASLYDQLQAAKTCNVDITAEPARKLPAESIYTKARPAVVIIGAIPKPENPHRSEPVFACGFVVHKDGVIVSNAHVIEAFQDMKAIGVMTSDGRLFPIKAILAADPLNDVAVLKIEATNLSPLPIAKTAPVGATVYCLSHPIMNSMGTKYGFFAFTHGIVSGRYRTQIIGETPVNVLTITADYAQGSSGGPILNENGAVVGMVCHTLAIEDTDGGNQMTWKLARPASSILPLLQSGQSAK